mgnify:CR=1 FL=1
MAKKTDVGNNETEEVLSELEKRISKEYKQAEEEVSEKLSEYLKKFEVKDNLKKQAVLNGQITEEEYKQWRVGQIAIGKRWEEMKDTLATDYTNVAQIAKSTAYSYMPEVYAINHNYGTFQVEKRSLVDTSYTLYDRQSVQRLFDDNNTLYHKAGRKVSEAINSGKQKAWDKKQIQSVMTQSLLQGESIGKIATRLSKAVGESDRKATIRNARTMTTGVQNAGRIDSYKRAQNMGIDLMQEWLASLDGRTRHEHRLLDGQRVPVGEKFEVEGEEIAFPGDPSASAHLIYNCRCTLVPVLKGFEVDSTDLSLRNTNHMEEETYEEWKANHVSHSDPITKQDEIEDTMRKAYGAEYRKQMNLNKATTDSKIKSEAKNDSTKKQIRYKTRDMTEEEYDSYCRDIESVSHIPTVKLSSEEYEIVRHAMNQFIYNSTDTEYMKRGVVTKEVRNHMYTVVNYGFNNYRVIKRKRIK